MNTIIKLAPGNVGWYDQVTGIHLTLARPMANVKPGMNTTNIKRAIKEGRILLLEGRLEQEVTIEPRAFALEEVVQSSNKEAITIKKDNIYIEEEVKTQKAKTKKTTKNKK